MRFTAEEAATALAPRLGYAPSREQIAMAFLDVDQDALTASQANRVTWEVWDRETPINDVPAERVLARGDMDGPVYLIYIDGSLTFLQPHGPNSSELLTDDTVAAVAGAQAAELLEGLAGEAILASLAAAIPSFAPTGPPEPILSPNIVTGGTTGTVVPAVASLPAPRSPLFPLGF